MALAANKVTTLCRIKASGAKQAPAAAARRGGSPRSLVLAGKGDRDSRRSEDRQSLPTPGGETRLERHLPQERRPPWKESDASADRCRTRPLSDAQRGLPDPLARGRARTRLGGDR